jgi:hypothetical protein
VEVVVLAVLGRLLEQQLLDFMVVAVQVVEFQRLVLLLLAVLAVKE